MAKKPRARAQRREAQRELTKLHAARERLFALEAGGAPERPLIVVSAAVIESQAESTPCPRCSGKLDLVEHVALTLPRPDAASPSRLREVRLRCRQCGALRSLWFRINDIGPN
ncbi:MAG TPA: hypothetical protein VIW29_00660 [Polyangiaceae bacterium]